MRIRTIILLLVVLALRTVAAERSSIRLQERVVVQQDGSADVAIIVTPDASVGLPLALPFGYGTPSSVQVSDSALTGTFMIRDGVPVLLIDGPRISPAPLQIMVRVNALTGWSGLKAGEFGNRTFRHEFRNTASLLISNYEGALLLPEGLTVSSVVSSEPAQTEKDPAAPFEVFVEGRRTGIIIRDSALSLGDVAQVTFRCKPAGKSPVLLICCSLAGILYLIFFRDVLKDNGNGSPAA